LTNFVFIKYFSDGKAGLISKSKEDIRLIADVARKMGMAVEYPIGDDIQMVEEPESLAEWDKLLPEQQQGLLDALDDVKNNGGKPHSEIMKVMRKKYE